MEWTRKNVLLVVLAGVAAYVGLQNLSALAGVLGWLLDMLFPFVLGGAIAFVLNVPMRAIERDLFPHAKGMAKLRRPLAYILTLVFVIGVLTLAGLVIVPGISDAFTLLRDQIPAALARAQEQLDALGALLPWLGEVIADLNIDWAELSQKALVLLRDLSGRLLSSGSGIVGDVVSGVATFVIAFIFSIYILLQKEKLARQGRQCLYALLPRRAAERAVSVFTLAEQTFSGFLSGQCLEAVILGAIFVLVLSILRMPYVLLIGVLISLTALIPVMGAFIGCVIGAVLIAISDPVQALLFVAVFLVVQQLENNLIYPQVVGSSVGLPSIWVLAAVTVGGSLMGVAGMLAFIPLCSVAYALFRDFIKQRLKDRGLGPEVWDRPAPAAAAEKAKPAKPAPSKRKQKKRK